jgi:biopolymer transport protein ExbD
MKIRQRSTKKLRIEIIPMIDVIFFLLVFFMISSFAMTRLNSVPVSLPKTSASAKAQKQDFIISIKKDGSLYVNKTQLNLENIGHHLADEMKDHPQEMVVINADQGVNYGLVVKVMDRARQIGVRKFALATEAGISEL